MFHGDFTLSSGKKATYYVDMRKLTLDHRAAPAIGRLVLDLVRDLEVDAVGGLTLGADPVATVDAATAVAPSDPSSRSSAGRSRLSPTKSLREMACMTGRPSATTSAPRRVR